jgi:HEAT repeat protein
VSTINPEIQRLVAGLADIDPEARLEAVSALGQYGASNEDLRGLDTHGIPALIDVLNADPVRELRVAAAYALGAIGMPAAVPALREMLATTEDQGLRLVIVKGLGKIVDGASVDVLSTALHTGESRCIRAAALKALQRIGTPDALRAAQA